MAFELAELDPTSVPINLLNPRPGTKFGERDLIDPWEAVKFIAIFRLILPAALFRLCGGRVENLGELQPLAVKAGLNGVMMGNFLTTLGSEPEDDRAHVRGAGAERRAPGGQRREPAARQPLRLARGRGARDADRRAGRPARPRRTSGIPRRSCGSARRASRPPIRTPARRSPPATRRLGRLTEPTARMSEIHDRLEELRDLGLYRRMRMVSGPQGPRVLLDGKRVLLLCSNNYLGLADHPRVREAAADAAMRYGVGAGASRLVSGNMTLHRRLEERLADFKRTRALPAVRLRLPRQHGRDHGARAGGRRRLLRRAQPREHHRRLPAGAGGDVRLRPPRHRPPRVGPARGGRPRQPDRDRRRVLDGRRRRAARADRRARAPLRRARDGRRGTRDRRARARGPRSRRGGRPRGRGRRRSSARSARRSAPTAPTSAATPRWRATS